MTALAAAAEFSNRDGSVSASACNFRFFSGFGRIQQQGWQRFRLGL
jgi:hypothetical protein